jgi:hypothetical protein
VTRPALLAAIGIAIISSAALFLFQSWSHPDLRTYAAALPKLPYGGVFIAGTLFAFLNAFLEEVIFRGVLFDAIASQFNRPLTVFFTALLFGYGHMHGYPPGPLGAVLAGLYGLALGWLRVFSGGLGLPASAHVVADSTIFAIVVHAGAI